MGESNVASARETLRRQLFATEDVHIDGENVPENKKEALRWENASSAQWRWWGSRSRCCGGVRLLRARAACMLFWCARRGFGGS